jgi:hypothetical protein
MLAARRLSHQPLGWEESMETIIGVIIGGFIGCVIPFTTLFLEHQRWKKIAKLEYLKSERSRLEKLFDEALVSFEKGMKKGSYSSDTSSDIFIFMPKEINLLYLAYMATKPKTLIIKKRAYLDLAMAMKKVLASLDKEIRDLVS